MEVPSAPLPFSPTLKRSLNSSNHSSVLFMNGSSAKCQAKPAAGKIPKRSDLPIAELLSTPMVPLNT